MIELLALKWGAVSSLVVGLGWALLIIASDSESLFRRYGEMYAASLQRQLSVLFLNLEVRSILWGQLLGFVAILGAAIVLKRAYLGVALVLPVFGPSVFLARRRKQRLQLLEAKMDGFLMTFVNALRATPNITKALSATQPLLSPPMSEEVGLVLAEMRVGTSLAQALSNMASRIQSSELDAVLWGILIGRKVGGDIPRILDSMADALREVARLRGVVRSKTAESRAQLWVLAVLPPLVLVLFDTAKAGYFEPLTRSWSGFFVLGVAAALWGTSIAMARKVLRVEP